MSIIEAEDAATKLAQSLLSSSQTKRWDSELGKAKPCAIENEKIGKNPRFWTALVRYSQNGNPLDGPAVIQVDLLNEKASWIESP